MDLNAFQDDNADGDLEYGQEEDQIQVNNPVQQTLQEIGLQKNQVIQNTEEESEEPSAIQQDHTPSFFS